MPSARKRPRPETFGRVIDFDEGVVQTCGPGEREELEAEMAMLTGAFAQSQDPDALRRMAQTLIRAGGENQDQRRHARRLASLLRLEARNAED